MNLRRKTIDLILLCFCLVLVAAHGAESREAVSPEVRVKVLLDSIGKIDRSDGIALETKNNNKKHSQAALAIFGMDEVSQKALGKYWKKISAEERKKFSELLSQLFLRVAFPNSAKFFAGLEMVYQKVEIEKNRAVVPVTVIHKEEGEVGIDFYLKDSGGYNWQVVDVLLDEVSMRNNLRSQFYRILKKHEISELFRRMEKKIKESQT
jgi:phospholipid transport system substrate-binding protein